MRHITDKGLALIKGFEGFRPTIYRCPGDHPTIGYGHRLSTEEQRRLRDGISPEDADILLRHDVGVAEAAVTRYIRASLTDCQFDALVSFVFNVGPAAFARSTLCAKLNEGRYDAVPRELLRWVRSGGRTLPGLVRRRQAEATLFTETPAANAMKPGRVWPTDQK